MGNNRRNPLQLQDDLEPVEEAKELLAQRQRQTVKYSVTTRDRSWDAQRNKMTFDLPPALIKQIRSLSKALKRKYPEAGIRVSDVAHLLLQEGLDQLEEGNLEIRPAVIEEVRRED